MFKQKVIHCIGYASDVAGAAPGSGQGPHVLQKSANFQNIESRDVTLHWEEMITPPGSVETKLEIVRGQCALLAKSVGFWSKQHAFFLVFGGDHSSAIGTWSGVHECLHENDQLGLIWIDAHMDSHTPKTSLTGNIHGMPLAVLLGHGETDLVTLVKSKPKLAPENLCLIGVRSFEQGEADLLNKLNVRIFYMDEVKKRGMVAVMQEAIAIVKKNTACFGVSLDIDAIDPVDAPGTGIAETDGIPVKELLKAFQLLVNERQLVGVEIAEFDPHFDREEMTEKWISKLVSALIVGK